MNIAVPCSAAHSVAHPEDDALDNALGVVLLLA